MYNYLKYFNKILFIQKGGSFPSWWEPVLAESKFLFDESSKYESYFTLLITGSVAIVYYLNELLTTDIANISESDQSILRDFVIHLKKPDDLDIFYPFMFREGSYIFYDVTTKILEEYRAAKSAAKPAESGSSAVSAPQLSLGMSLGLSLGLSIKDNPENDVKTCEAYLDIGAFRQCAANVRQDITFERRPDYEERGLVSVFEKIDFNRLKYRDENPYKYVEINGVKILGIKNLIELYRLTERGVDATKIGILNKLIEIISKNDELIKKYKLE